MNTRTKDGRVRRVLRTATIITAAGRNPSEGNTKFCPNDTVTRSVMAIFLRNLADRPAPPSPDANAHVRLPVSGRA